MSSPPPFPTLRELRGAAISTLLSLFIAGHPVTRTWIERATGYTTKPIRNALRYLRDSGLAVYTLTGWTLTQVGSQLPALLKQGGWKISLPIIIRTLC